MTRMTTHPQTRSRRERALAQRRNEMLAWGAQHKLPNWKSANVRVWNSDADKIQKCQVDIANLERKLVSSRA